jgi:hypothetical protein
MDLKETEVRYDCTGKSQQPFCELVQPRIKQLKPTVKSMRLGEMVTGLQVYELRSRGMAVVGSC